MITFLFAVWLGVCCWSYSVRWEIVYALSYVWAKFIVISFIKFLVNSKTRGEKELNFGKCLQFLHKYTYSLTLIYIFRLIRIYPLQKRTRIHTEFFFRTVSNMRPLCIIFISEDWIGMRVCTCAIVFKVKSGKKPIPPSNCRQSLGSMPICSNHMSILLNMCPHDFVLF